jgi:hypothetical protein
MKWLQDNPFLAGLSAVTLIGAGILGYLLSQSLTQYQEASDGYAQAVQKLHTLQNRVPFPNSENLEKNKALVDQYKSDLTSLRTKLSAMVPPLNPAIKPQQFQDDLRSAVNDTVDKATKAGITLPKDFYLGFGQYANSLPSEQAAPALARQLTLIKDLVQRLIAFKIQSIDYLERTPLPQEATAAAPKAGAPAKVLERFPFDISFTAEQSKFRVALNSLLGSDQFLIIRALNVQNSSPTAPAIATEGGDSNAGSPQAAPAGAAGQPNLNVILGRELVQVSARIEMIEFTEAPEAKK